MRILYLTQWFEPEPAFKGLAFAQALKAAGHEVEVATGFPNYPAGRAYPGYAPRPYRRDVMDDIVVHRLWLYPSHDDHALRRMLNYGSFFLSSLLFGLWRGGRYDIVYVYHPPLMPALAAALFGWVRRLPFVLDVQDLWPDTVAASGMAGRRLVGLIDRMCGFVYRRAAAIVCQSDGIREALATRVDEPGKLVTIHNWADDQAYDPPATTDLSRYRFGQGCTFVYGGNFGQAQNLRVAIDAAIEARRQDPSIRLLLIGGGPEEALLAAHIAERQADQVEIHPPVSRAAIADVFHAADVLLCHLKDDPLYRITIPSKVQYYAACGRPILAGLAGEAADIVRRTARGTVVPPDDVAAMRDGMLTLAARHRRGELAGRDVMAERTGLRHAADATLAVIAGCRGERER
jgi:colanic acid biosynthesis glycosyl transferase WcaI